MSKLSPPLLLGSKVIYPYEISRSTSDGRPYDNCHTRDIFNEVNARFKPPLAIPGDTLVGSTVEIALGKESVSSRQEAFDDLALPALKQGRLRGFDEHYHSLVIPQTPFKVRQ